MKSVPQRHQSHQQKYEKNPRHPPGNPMIMKVGEESPQNVRIDDNSEKPRQFWGIWKGFWGILWISPVIFQDFKISRFASV